MIGIDIVEIKRFEHFLEKKKALSRYLNDEEISLVTSPSSAAGFFASKEAISKALGTGIGKICTFKDIQLHKESSGAPYFTLSKELIERFKITKTALSISHDGGFAIAVAVISSHQEQQTPLFH